MILKMRQYFHIVTKIKAFAVAVLWSACSGPTAQNQAAQNENAIAVETVPDDTSQKRNILFFGNSLTAGLGLDDINEAFPSLIQAKIDSLGLPYHCINAGLSGETSAGGKERIDWLLQQPVSIFVLELGANDGLRGVSTESTFSNLEEIVEKVKAANPDCKLILAGMKVPPSMGQQYFTEFEAIFPKLAEKHQMTLIPFLLEDVAGITSLNQSDGVHPTAEGQKLMAKHVWNVLEPLL